MSMQAESYLEEIFKNDADEYHNLIRRDQIFELCFIGTEVPLLDNSEIKNELGFKCCEFVRSGLKNVNARFLNLQCCRIYNTEFRAVKIGISDENEDEAPRSTFAFSEVSHTIFEDCVFSDVHFYSSMFNEVVFKNCHFKNCVFDDSCKLVLCKFENCRGKMGDGIKITPNTVFINVSFVENERLIATMTSKQYSNLFEKP